MSFGSFMVLTIALTFAGGQADPIQPDGYRTKAAIASESDRAVGIRQWMSALRSHVMANWDPPKAAIDLAYPCRAHVIIDVSGQVSSVAFLKPCGAALEKSIEEAIRDSSPLPLPSDPRHFTKNVLLNFMPIDKQPAG